MIGQQIGRYTILQKLGQGGMGSVYLAEDTFLGRRVAIKLMSPDLAQSVDGVERFKREARSLAALQHPNIVGIYDCLAEGENLCLVMELVDGFPLDRLIREHKQIALADKLRLMAAVCRALEYAHGKRVIHRDLKPPNILVARDGSPKIVDFGIAKMMDETGTRSSALMGTIAYMSPEQFQGLHVTTQTDVFSAGVVLYELLTGTQPFLGSSTAQTMHNILMRPLPPLTDAGIPPRLNDILARAVAKEPAQRYATTAEFGAGLEQCGQDFSQAERIRMQPPITMPDRATSIETAPVKRSPLASEVGRSRKKGQSEFQEGLRQREQAKTKTPGPQKRRLKTKFEKQAGDNAKLRPETPRIEGGRSAARERDVDHIHIPEKRGGKVVDTQELVAPADLGTTLDATSWAIILTVVTLVVGIIIFGIWLDLHRPK